MNKKLYIISTVLFCSLLMCFVDGVISPSYVYKSIFKVILFLLIPAIYLLKNKEDFVYLKRLFIPKKKYFLIALILGFGVYAVIMLAYFLLKDFIDLTNIQSALTNGIGVNKDNFILVAIYISFVNSLLEEFFFRGYAFMLLKKYSHRLLAYGFSSLLFAFYHLGMTSGWFSIIIYVLAIIGLAVGGCIFNYLNESMDSIYPSWLVHMFANFAINTVGCILFGIL